MKRLGLVVLFGSLTACAGLRTSEYRSAGEFNTPLRGPAAAAPHSSQEAFTLAWPVDSVQINRGYQVYKKRPHWGVDLGGHKGLPIRASHQGRVIYAGTQFKGYGKMVLVEYNNRWATLYAHLSKVTVKQGEYVLQGQKVGEMGRTGHATGVHLHFELMHDKQPVDPLTYLRVPQTVVDHSWRDSSFLPSPTHAINQVHTVDVFSESNATNL